MYVLALSLSAILLILTTLHVYWGIGGVWPGTDTRSCAHAVVGFRGVNAMPDAFASFSVAACLGLATLWPLAMIGIVASPFSRTGLAAAAVLIALVFLGRGVAGFMPFWRRLAPVQPFATLDRKYYAPLCLVMGLGFAILALSELSR
ncbi:DUF3995 domain-containing protein [Mesorhizobium sp. NBSH29]|nr:DUF3995 domain-containing protein [Mesorhizobium sp. NBSH29]QPC88549.1 DUF3995 domain-containing protein [Mesorhizobium sp. NBSH29]